MDLDPDLVAIMRHEGVDVTDPVAVQNWLEQTLSDGPACDSPLAGDFGFLDEMLDEAGAADSQLPALSPVRLPSEEQLARAAAGSRIHTMIDRFAVWLETADPDYTEDGVLGPEHARAAARALGIGASTEAPERAAVPPQTGPGQPLGSAPVDGAHPDLLRVMRLALASGVGAETARGLRVAPERPRLAPLGDGELLEAWLECFATLTDQSEYCLLPEHDGFHLAERVVGLLIYGLYVGGRLRPLTEELAQLIEDVLADERIDGERAERLRGTALAASVAAVERLAAHGALDVDPAGRVTLTPLGLWGAHELFDAAGLAAPVLGGYARASAAELVEALAGYDDAETAEEFEGWAAQRPATEAARELVEVARDGDSRSRALAMELIGRLGPDTEPAVRAALREPVVRPYAWRLLTDWKRDPGGELTAAERAWLAVDSVAALAEASDPQGFADALLDVVPVDRPELVDELWQADHPQTGTALDLLGQLHPDARVAERARRAAAKVKAKTL
ncbi:hypothetical protein CLV72_1047 [Allonocardiopsis opalescens]|uniref:Uncharacterized protein n=1 Tax=Allonocardiopsis opalescens TaxID=1144618 RepID=A0A2T0Q3Z8_9ACTN|nr:hypothetical protein CLV72_1047 [Allonocardiopsis opalescens]